MARSRDAVRVVVTLPDHVRLWIDGPKEHGTGEGGVDGCNVEVMVFDEAAGAMRAMGYVTAEGVASILADAGFFRALAGLG